MKEELGLSQVPTCKNHCSTSSQLEVSLEERLEPTKKGFLSRASHARSDPLPLPGHTRSDFGSRSRFEKPLGLGT